MILESWIEKNVNLLRSEFFPIHREWIVFQKKRFEDTVDYIKGDMGFVLHPDGFLTTIRKYDKDISVKSDSFVPLNGEISLQPLIKAVEEYWRSKNPIFKRYHAKRCFSHLKYSLKYLNVRQLYAAKEEVEKALSVYEVYYSCLSWKDYNKGEEYFLHHIGRAILEIR